MHLHILGICGTFMAGVAALAREAGHRVSGSDAAAWPPMSTQLAGLGIRVHQGYDPAHIADDVDCVVVGNVISRGNPAIEHVLDAGMPYTSGPQWLGEHVLPGRHVFAVAGTHGKTTTASLLAWLLEAAGERPGFLIGGVPGNFGVSARIGAGRAFVVEADEYDTAFFDKRSKFLHYRPRTLVLNNLEFDHADIFEDLAAIQRQFHHLVRTVPRSGQILYTASDAKLAEVLEMGCWSRRVLLGDPEGWQLRGEGEALAVWRGQQRIGEFACPLPGRHNRANALAAVAAACEAGADPDRVLAALPAFRNARRRLEVRGEIAGVQVIDDFAHHPTAIRETIAALRETGPGRIIAVLEPRSNTMRMGVHGDAVAHALSGADLAFVLHRGDLRWQPRPGERLAVVRSVEDLVAAVAEVVRPGDRVLVMSNGDFGGFHERLLARLAEAAN